MMITKQKIRFSFIAAAFVLGMLNCPALDETGMIVHFTFDNDTPSELKSTDGKYSFKPREGVKADLSTVEFSEGVHGKALHLKNGNVIHYCLPPGTLTDFKPPFTIALWIKRTTAKAKHNHGIFCGTCADPKDFGFEFSWFHRRLLLHWGNGRKLYTVASADHSLAVNKWHHVAAAHDGKAVTLYVDAVPIIREEVGIPFIEVPKNKKSANRFTLGNYPTTFHAYPHIGLIDDFFLFSRALSREEIVSLADGIKQ